MKWILMIDLKANFYFLVKLIDSLLHLCEYSETSLISSFKFGFKFLQFIYDEKEKFQPIYTFFVFLRKVYLKFFY